MGAPPGCVDSSGGTYKVCFGYGEELEYLSRLDRWYCSLYRYGLCCPRGYCTAFSSLPVYNGSSSLPVAFGPDGMEIAPGMAIAAPPVIFVVHS